VVFGTPNFLEIAGMGSPAWKRLIMALLCSMLLDSKT
jgi:hypothetical protein